MAEKTEAITLVPSLRLDILLPVIGFVLPLVVSGSQIITGSLVNALLVLFAHVYSKKNAFFMCVAPSVGALFNGVLFGRFTFSLLYFMPFIWIANFIFIALHRKLKNYGVIFMVCISAVIKSGVLFTAAYIFVSGRIVPGIFLTGMGIFQLATAVIGSCIAFGVLRQTTYARR